MAQDINSDASQEIPQTSPGATPSPPLTGVTPPESVSPQVIAPTPPAQPINPVPSAQVNSPLPPAAASPPQPLPATPVNPVAPQVPAATQPPKPSFFKRLFGHKKYIAIVVLVLLFGGAITGSYLFGKSHERIIIQAPTPQPINLPAQTIVVNECKPGRGKQFILPKDIPLGPVYDVVNNKVIAVEYNFKASDLFVNADKLSDTLIPFFKGNYKTENFTVTTGTLQPGQSQADTPVNVAIFVVTKDEVNKITCKTTP